MNTNTGNDPMLSSFINDDWVKVHGSPSITPNHALSLFISQPTTSSFLAPPEEILSPDSNFTDLAEMWSTERRRVLSIKIEDDDSFSSYSVSEDVDEGDADMEEIKIENSNAVDNIRAEIEDHEFGNVTKDHSEEVLEYKYDIFKHRMTELEARRYVEEQFAKIAFVPKANLSHREKIESILSMSECKDFTVDGILNFDKKCPDSARACAKIVQNIPQRYRWECVQPEDIPCCYTIVADCKKASYRDKPPRPMNAFMIWAQGARRLINELCPRMQNAIISEALGFYWREKSDAFKQRFEQEKKKLRIFHNVEFPEYKYKPKTKIQKAREKQQLILTKAKLRASAKQDHVQNTVKPKSPRSSTSGRPKKTKQTTPSRKSKDIRNTSLEDTARKLKTLPAIKDMLTLKILNDRKCKGVLSVTPNLQKELFCRSFGQISPLEIDDVNEESNNDVIAEMLSIDISGKKENGFAMKTISSSSSSSVFDTPANTPPVDDVSDDPRVTPPPTIQSTLSLSSVQAQQSSNKFPPSDNTAPTTIPTVHILPIKGGCGISLLELVTKGAGMFSLKQRSPSTTTPDQLVDITEVLFNLINYSQTTSDDKSSSKYPIYNSTQNNSDLNNNISLNDINNNSVDQTTSVPVMNKTISKLTTESNVDTSSDLDTLLLDLNAPLLSDDDLRSILNTL